MLYLVSEDAGLFKGREYKEIDPQHFWSMPTPTSVEPEMNLMGFQGLYENI